MVFLLISGCAKEDTDLLRKETPVLTGMIRSLIPDQQISFFTMSEEYAGTPSSRKATLSLLHDGQWTDWTPDVYHYRAPDAFTFKPDSTYSIRVHDDLIPELVECTFKMPPAINLLVGITDTVHISNPGSVAGLISWNALDDEKYSYVFKLECLESNPVHIPGQYGFFEERYDGPQLSPQLLMLKSDFKYYGRHKLTILAIDRALDALFFYDAADMRSQLRNGPDNVSGAAGFVAGVTGFETEVIIWQ